MRSILIAGGIVVSGLASGMCPSGVETARDAEFPMSEERPWNEISGLAASRRFPNIVYVASDGSDNRVAAVNMNTGEHLATYEMALDVKPVDKEDLALGPCSPGSDKDCIFAGDIGDNLAKDTKGKDGRPVIRVYKFEEPELPDDTVPVKVPTEVLSFRYKWNLGENDDAPVRHNDSEAMFVDHATSDLYFLTKFNKGRRNVRLYRFPFAHQTKESYPVPAVSDSDFLRSHTWSRASYSRNRKLVAIGTDDELWFFPVPDGMDIGEALAGEPCPFVMHRQSDGTPNLESVSFTADSKRLVEISECRDDICPVPIWVSTLTMDEGTASGADDVGGQQDRE